MYRYIARIVLEAETPIAVGTDKIQYDQDAPVEKDFNGLPYIPGTALAGAIKAGLGDVYKYLFGKSDEKESKGSNLVFSDALLYDGCKVNQELLSDPFDEEYYSWFKNLPVRTHASHDHKGTAKDQGLFDQEIVYSGSRFKFELMLESDKDKKVIWDEILAHLQIKPLFLGAGQYKGFGLCKILEISTFKAKDFDEYLKIDTDLNNNFLFEASGPIADNIKWTTVKLNTEKSFLHFGSGFADDDTDATCYQEKRIIWNESKPSLQHCYVIPGTSVKGAFSHRLAFNYNIETNVNIEKLWEQANKDVNEYSELVKKHTGSENDAVKYYFGTAKESTSKTGQSGRLIFKDIFIPIIEATEVKFMHNTIDRFTGGTIDTALFSEKTINVKELNLKYFLEASVVADSSTEIPTTTDDNIVKAFEKTLSDLSIGDITIGGMAAKGHGIVSQPITETKA